MENSKKNDESYADREKALHKKWSQEGRLHVHYCPDWDFMLLHSETPEYQACCCDRPSQIFSNHGAPARLGEEVEEFPPSEPFFIRDENKA